MSRHFIGVSFSSDKGVTVTQGLKGITIPDGVTVAPVLGTITIPGGVSHCKVICVKSSKHMGQFVPQQVPTQWNYRVAKARGSSTQSL